MSLRLVTPPEDLPVTIEEARTVCRVIGADEDAMLTMLIAAATAHVEQYIGRSIQPQTWELVLDDFDDSILIPRGPVTAIESVKYYDADEQLQTVPDSSYALDAVSDPQWLVRATSASWPTVASGVNNVIIRFAAGYAETAPQRAAIRQAILLLIVQWFDNPSAVVVGTIVTSMPNAVDALLCNIRSFS
ncbi:head-tail connector protein [Sphingopyxis sp.]|jgi:uncharacterized phiE125 gp8 family phage protein|uniref:head-tail connector protein n=1 Tax=Sphingopyxis sp. TaxID=1908224 RepID=UPI003F6FB262